MFSKINKQQINVNKFLIKSINQKGADNMHIYSNNHKIQR